MALLAVQGAKASEDWFNWADLVIKKEDAEALIPRKTARILQRLQQQNNVPKWAWSMIDKEKVRLAAL